MRDKLTFDHLTLLSALFISSVAIYFSVAGLAAIFSAYAISIIIMGTAIELGKLVGVAWLHKNWHHALWWMKTGLILLVASVMFLTSMGIFGYLSKSHVEQTSASQESVAQVQRIDTEIARLNAIITRSEQKINSFEENGSGVDASLNAQIDKEQTRIDSAYERVKPVINVQLDIIASEEDKITSRTKLYTDEIMAINVILADLQQALSDKKIRVAQGIVGTRPDGSYREKTQAAIKDFRTRKETRRNLLLKKVDGIRATPSASSAESRAEIKRIRATVQSEINESNATIKRLRSRMGQTNANDIETLITDERTRIKESNTELDVLTQDKYTREATFRKLEAEVGPIKYIAEFVYDKKADDALLERAVQWVIILIIFVFDPFAVLLLIASQYSFERSRAEREALDAVKDEALAKISKVVEQTEKVLHEAETVEHTLEDLVGGYQPNHGTLDDNDPPQEDGTTLDVPRKEPWKDLNELSDIAKGLNLPLYDGERKISMTRTGEHYINFNGKVYRMEALVLAFPELHLDFSSEVKSGIGFPVPGRVGEMFIRTDIEPTHLFIFNGDDWDKVDKNILDYSAYGHEYINTLIKKVGNRGYNPELLNEAEKMHIEELLGRE